MLKFLTYYAHVKFMSVLLEYIHLHQNLCGDCSIRVYLKVLHTIAIYTVAQIIIMVDVLLEYIDLPIRLACFMFKI